MKAWLAVVDRTAVLFLGLAAGVAIGFAFRGEAPSIAPAPRPTVAGKTMPGKPTAAEVAAAPECALPFQPQLLDTVTAGRPIRVGVFGDSFGDGVWSGLHHQLTKKTGYEVVKFSQQATGFTRYKSLDLERHAAEQLGDAPIDIAVISYGANDTQGIITSAGKFAALMSPGWQEEVGGRVDRYVALLRRHGAMVYWIGLPRMRKGSFDADIQAMNAFYESRMAALGVPFIDPRPFASDAAGQYAAYLPDPRDGHATLIRADDGIHMSMNGYIWITRTLAARIRAYIAAAQVRAGVAPAPVVSARAAPPLPVPVPVAVAPPPKPAMASQPRALAAPVPAVRAPLARPVAPPPAARRDAVEPARVVPPLEPPPADLDLSPTDLDVPRPEGRR